MVTGISRRNIAAVFVLTTLLTRDSQADDLPVDVLRVAHAIDVNRNLLRHLPLYTCLETIVRSRPGLKGSKPQKADVVQVDVGVGADREIYSWPCERTFSAADLGDLVGHGLLSTGLFQSFANSLFVLGHGNVKFAGEDSVEGRAAYRFTYQVPSLESRWNIDWQGKHGVLSQHGEFWVRRDDFTLLRLHVMAEEIPLSVPLNSLEIWIGYQALLLNGTPTEGPVNAELTAVERTGKTYRNSFTFSQCRVFEAESKLSNEAGDLEQKLTQYEAQQSVLPAGVKLIISLQQAIGAKSSKVGDVITARLDASSKLPQGSIIPAGAVLNGRIRQFAQLHDPPNTYLVGIEFNELAAADRHYRFLAEMIGMQELPGLTTAIFSGSSERVRAIGGRAYLTTTEKLLPDRILGVATFFLQERREIPKGFRTTWRTGAIAHP